MISGTPEPSLENFPEPECEFLAFWTSLIKIESMKDVNVSNCKYDFEEEKPKRISKKLEKKKQCFVLRSVFKWIKNQRNVRVLFSRFKTGNSFSEKWQCLRYLPALIEMKCFVKTCFATFCLFFPFFSLFSHICLWHKVNCLLLLITDVLVQKTRQLHCLKVTMFTRSTLFTIE